MSLEAAELADRLIENKIKAEKQAYDSFKHRAVTATSQMLSELEEDTVLDLNDGDMLILERVTEELRELGYKFCLVEVQSSTGEILNHKLRISVKHLCKTV